MATSTVSVATDAFIAVLEKSIDRATLVKLILGKYRGVDAGLRTVNVRTVVIRDQVLVSMVYRYQTRDITKNLPVPAAITIIRDMLGHDFKSGELFTTEADTRITFNRHNDGIVHSTPATLHQVPDLNHDRDKTRHIDSRRPFLHVLGITTREGRVMPSMSHKWRQINVFLELFQRAYGTSTLPHIKRSIEVVDFGAGKGYLTFAISDYFQNDIGVNANVTGVELRDDLVQAGNIRAAEAGLAHLHFLQGNLKNCDPLTVDILIALHACDTATDIAIHRGIRAGASIIMCAPCCHKEIRPQIVIPLSLQPIFQFGVHLGAEAEMVTDSLRALWLEFAGYTTQVFEFIGAEHTDKNRMIMAIKHDRHVAGPVILDKIAALKKFYGVTHHTLEQLLRADDPAVTPDPGAVRD